MTTLNKITDNPGARKSRIRVGRGIGSTKGKTGGRGVKGQKSRTGVAIKGYEGGQMPIHMRLPKRGFKNIFRLDYNVINLDKVQAAVDAGKLDAKAKVDVEALVKAGILRRAKDGVRLLAQGKLTSKLSFSVAGASEAAKAAVEKAGGSIEILAPKVAAAE
ncbi:MAG: 50S ribosomal protein L15 [Parvibaculum sp.]|jgi:large subunit ribosomal protein L15|uniref:50S ribosomal protein L15 n=1 Tax=Parvibaculum sp. TaxID=2024848 RepID=UPI00284A5C95|nr:50S ribosomal protein L15 [Parvibaculum sp.]MDR3499106.1 50S ribosomal protein L15 [Parvibaculum sp.]